MGRIVWSSKAERLFGDGSKIEELEAWEREHDGDNGPHVFGDWEPYVSQNMGHEPVLIEGKKKWREELKRRGLECVDSGRPYVSREDALRKRRRRTFLNPMEQSS